MKYQEMRSKIVEYRQAYSKKFINWDNQIMPEWEIKLLKDLNYITDKGVVYRNSYKYHLFNKYKNMFFKELVPDNKYARNNN